MADPATTENTPTTNYSFNLPLVGGDDNAWGDLLNENWSSIDTILWTVSGVASAALTQTAGDARYLRQIGGTVGPNSLIVNGPSSFTNYTQVTGQFVSSGGATFGTAQVFFNSQVTFSADALMVTPAASDNSQRAATTSWVNAAIGALPTPPSPSTTPPLMNGTAAAGSSALYSRGDHVHPVDTSRYAASNPSGYQTAAQVTASLGPYALTASVPVASTTTPLMSGAAAVGTGTTWARADHVHPSDTSMLPRAGVTDGSNAAAGQIGEVISGSNTTGAGLATGAVFNVVAITLTPGDWDVSGEVLIAVGTGCTTVAAALGPVSGTFPGTASINGARNQITGLGTAFTGGTQALPLKTSRASISVSTVYYLMALCNFTGGTTTATGAIWARRAR